MINKFEKSIIKVPVDDYSQAALLNTNAEEGEILNTKQLLTMDVQEDHKKLITEENSKKSNNKSVETVMKHNQPFEYKSKGNSEKKQSKEIKNKFIGDKSRHKFSGSYDKNKAEPEKKGLKFKSKK